MNPLSTAVALVLREHCRPPPDLARVLPRRLPGGLRPEAGADPAHDVPDVCRSRRGAGPQARDAVARALGPDALKRAFTDEDLRWLCHDCHRRKTALDRRVVRYLRACSLDRRSACRVLQMNRGWFGAFLAPLGLADTAEGPMIRAA